MGNKLEEETVGDRESMLSGCSHLLGTHGKDRKGKGSRLVWVEIVFSG